MSCKWLRNFGWALLGLLGAAQAVRAEVPGDVILDMRLRSETVDQDGFGKDAHALTLRTRLGYETAAWRGFRALMEAENVSALDDDYNSSTNGKHQFPLVPDPTTTELNRLQVSWKGPRGDMVVGRQRLILGNARFVGNVGFRQNEQTFDAARATLRPTDAVTLTYAYLDRTHRVLGDDHPQGEWDTDAHLVQADFKTALGQFTGYGYLMSFENAPEQSNATWGARLAGSRPLAKGVSVSYEAEFARQDGYRNNPADFDLDYTALSVGLKSQAVWGRLGLERLGGDGRRGFVTPLATLHAFQGWADAFQTTPVRGVRDMNLRAGATLKAGRLPAPLKLATAVHEFTDDDGGRRYGREMDLLVGVPLSERLSAEIKAAFFDGDQQGFADRTKVWLTMEWKY